MLWKIRFSGCNDCKPVHGRGHVEYPRLVEVSLVSIVAYKLYCNTLTRGEMRRKLGNRRHSAERPCGRKVRAPQGRVPDNVRRERS